MHLALKLSHWHFYKEELKLIMIKESDSGQVQISDDVLAIISGTAALEVEGVVGLPSNFSGDIVGLLGKKNFSKGVKIELAQDGNLKIEINLLVKFGYKIQDISLSVQQKVKSAIETMTGLNTSEINIHVTGVNFEKAKKNES